MKIIALEEHFIMPQEEQNLPPGAHRGNDREKLLGFDVVAELLNLGDTRLAAMDAAGIDVQVLSHNQPGCQALDADAAIPMAREVNDLLFETIKTHPDRFAGLHFFNPVPIMKLVEVIRALTTSDETYKTVFAFAESLGKEPITAPDRPGFIVNRLLVPYLLDAIRAYENGLGTLEDIDKGMKLGCGYPMGPFTLLDFVGLDTTYYIANIMYEEFREPAYAPPPLLKRMVLAGRMGRKTGHGFYKY